MNPSTTTTETEPTQVTVASTMAGYLRGGGVLGPVIAGVLAIACGGMIMLLAGSNPLSTYHAIFNGSGLNWFLPWVGGEDRLYAGQNLQQTLLIATPLILAGLAVALAFRAGLFNIGGQGQYIVGTLMAVWLGSRMTGLNTAVHIAVAVLGGGLGGAIWAGISGYLRAATGASEVISTIMLNWIALWAGVYLVGINGPLQNSEQSTVPVSVPILESARLPVIWGDPELQGLHLGVFVALVAAFIFWFVLRRTVWGFEIRALGFNPEAAAYGGINVRYSYVRVMALCGMFAGLAGSLDVLGWQFQVASNDIQASMIGFLGIAVGLLGRNTASGVVLAAFLFAVLVNGTAIRNLDPNIFAPQLASNLTLLLQGAIVLWVSAPGLMTVVKRLRVRTKNKPMSAEV